MVAIVTGALVLASGIALIVLLSSGGKTGTDARRAAADTVTSSAGIDSVATAVTSAGDTPAAARSSAGDSSGTSSPSPTAPAPQVVYVVKPGDNLTVIARWFHEHGYGDLYDRNRSVIGDNPNLIRPGQRIVVVDGTMKLS